MVMLTRLETSVPAKINLHLRVLGQRRDGFHELSTLFQSIDLFDHLTAVHAPPGTLCLEVDPVGAVGTNDDNLVLRAARALADVSGSEVGASLKLQKKIPVGGGLGGGSADAAAALVLLDRLWGCGLDGSSLHKLAADLGSDVPFFLHGGLVHGGGRGDEVFELDDLEQLAVVVTVPNVRISTAEVFGLMDARLTSNRQEGTVYAFAADLRRRLDWQEMTNELEDVVVSCWPKVGEGLRILRSSGPLHASLSGSGAAIFAVFGSAEAARRVAGELPASWFVHVGTTLQRPAAQLEVGVVRDGGRR